MLVHSFQGRTAALALLGQRARQGWCQATSGSKAGLSACCTCVKRPAWPSPHTECTPLLLCMLARVAHALQGPAHRSTSADDRPSASSLRTTLSWKRGYHPGSSLAHFHADPGLTSPALLQYMSRPAGVQHAWRGSSVSWHPMKELLPNLAQERGTGP